MTPASPHFNLAAAISFISFAKTNSFPLKHNLYWARIEQEVKKDHKEKKKRS
jgi:hypothetical protein